MASFKLSNIELSLLLPVIVFVVVFTGTFSMVESYPKHEYSTFVKSSIGLLTLMAASFACSTVISVIYGKLRFRAHKI